jgi:hypothetical protein
MAGYGDEIESYTVCVCVCDSKTLAVVPDMLFYFTAPRCSKINEGLPNGSLDSKTQPPVKYPKKQHNFLEIKIRLIKEE